MFRWSVKTVEAFFVRNVIQNGKRVVLSSVRDIGGLGRAHIFLRNLFRYYLYLATTAKNLYSSQTSPSTKNGAKKTNVQTSSA